MAAQVNFYFYLNVVPSPELVGAWKLAHICQIKAVFTYFYVRNQVGLDPYRSNLATQN